MTNPFWGPAQSEQFSLEPLFVPGSIYGLRTWRLHDSGPAVLYPVASATDTAWKNGVNEAFCTKTLSYHRTSLAITPDGEIREDTTESHRVAQLNCTCGYYAYGYQDQHNPYVDDNRGLDYVSGIIEAFGTVTAGTKGFRASKAKIVALQIPRETLAATQNGPWDKLRMRERWAHTKACGALVHYGQRRAVELGVENLTENCSMHPIWDMHRVRYAELVQNYSDARIFHSREEMLAEYPVNLRPEDYRDETKMLDE